MKKLWENPYCHNRIGGSVVILDFAFQKIWIGQIRKGVEKLLLSLMFSVSEPVLDELELPHRYRPDNIQLLCDATG